MGNSCAPIPIDDTILGGSGPVKVEVALWYRILLSKVICVARTASAMLLVNNDFGLKTKPN